MLFTTLTLRSRLVACAASIALVSGLAATPAEAGSKEKFWFQRGSASDQLSGKERTVSRPAPGNPPALARVTPPAQPVQPAPPAYGNGKRKQGRGGQAVAPAPRAPQIRGTGNASRHERHQVTPRAPQPPQWPNRVIKPGSDRKHAGPPAPPVIGGDRNRARPPISAPPAPPKPVARQWPRQGDDRGRGHDERHRGDDGRHHGDDGRHHGNDRYYKDEHRHHETHVTHHHVQRHYYYRTSSSHYYYYYPVPYPRPYSYPVYYLVPYHIHATPGYHNHGEEATYCSDGYAQGGVYRGGAYTRGASHQTSGAIIGSILGAAAGYQVGNGKGQLVAVGVGTLLGALIGSDVGRAMDERDRAYATGSFGHAMETVPSCTTISWNNPQTGNYGTVTPVHTYQPEPGRYCREFQQQVVIGGELQDAYGTACRQPDGSWEIVAEQP